jgi:hypothetical protein
VEPPVVPDEAWCGKSIEQMNELVKIARVMEDLPNKLKVVIVGGNRFGQFTFRAS